MLWILGGILLWIWLRSQRKQWERIEQVRRDYEFKGEQDYLNNQLNKIIKKSNKILKR